MATLATLQRRTANLAQEIHRLYPNQDQPGTAHLTEQERAGLEAFNDHMQALGKVSEGPAPRLLLEQLTEDELDQALYWSNVIHREQDRKAGKI